MTGRATEIKEFPNEWRVYFPPYSIGGAYVKEIIREWCEENCTGQFRLFLSHVRFRNPTDAEVFFLLWR